ncbi:MAG: copper chaperone PCu(A)C [Pseudohongiellaceae bacterium]
MNLKINIKKLVQLFIMPLALTLSVSVYAQPLMIPGFMGIESSYAEAPDAGSDAVMAYFTITNLHYEPILILSASVDHFESATFNNIDHEEVESIVIQPSQRLVMEPGGYHLHLSEINLPDSDLEAYEITLLVRRGLEAMEEVEGSTDNFGAMSGVRIRDAGIPNHQEFIINVPIRN